MSEAKTPANRPSEEVMRMLRDAGIGAETIEATVAIDAVLQTWRRQANRRELGQHALADLGIALDLAQLDVLFAIDAPRPEFGDTSGEAMVATVAERLGIDPSRASRLVSELVSAGYARRAASQQDARRTIVELTERGETVITAVRGYKWLVLGHFLADWTEAEMATFLPLLHRFSRWNSAIGTRKHAFAPEIAALAEDLARSEKAISQREAG